MKIKLEQAAPMEIEARSMELIAAELGDRPIPEENRPVVLRCIHTTADFDYADNLCFSENAVKLGVEALAHGAGIVTDTTMAMAGINKRVLSKFGGQVYNFIGDPAVAAEARERGITRSAVSMERAAGLGEHLIYAVGNAPTALIRLYELWSEGRLPRPALIIGVPVGFVNVVEAKELIMQTDCPYIVARGRKGGSNVAAAVCNALLYIASQDVRE